MNLSHYTKEPIKTLRSIAQATEVEISSYKPRGLWLSVDGEHDWKSWCEAELFELESLKHRYRVYLKKDSNILRLTSTQDILNFTEKYNRVYRDYGLDWHGHFMDWTRLATEYQGLIISPYNWELRLDRRVHWYYGWDCASGCIWDANAIDKFEEIV